jgi:hypothetical protein
MEKCNVQSYAGVFLAPTVCLGKSAARAALSIVARTQFHLQCLCLVTTITQHCAYASQQSQALNHVVQHCMIYASKYHDHDIN